MEENHHQLFDQCNICIVCSKELSLDAANQVFIYILFPFLLSPFFFRMVRVSACIDCLSLQLALILQEHGCEAIIYEPLSPFPPLSQFTHLISCTIDFPVYDAACDALIPVVKPQWAYVSLSRKRLSNPRQYSPDPRLFLNDVVVTCGDIPSGDKEAIIGGVLAKGGIYSPKVSHTVTHLVDLTVESEKARIVISRRLNVKIVLPHW